MRNKKNESPDLKRWADKQGDFGFKDFTFKSDIKEKMRFGIVFAILIFVSFLIGFAFYYSFTK